MNGAPNWLWGCWGALVTTYVIGMAALIVMARSWGEVVALVAMLPVLAAIVWQNVPGRGNGRFRK